MTLHYKRNKNQDLWELLDAETAARRVRFEWVRGHGDDPINNRADELALMGANRQADRRRRVAGEAKDATSSKSDDSSVEAELATRLEAGRIDSRMRGMRREVRQPRRRRRLLLADPCQLDARDRVTR